MHNRRKNTKNLPRKQKILVGHNKTSQGCKNIYTMWCKQKSRTKFIKKRKKKERDDDSIVVKEATKGKWWWW